MFKIYVLLIFMSLSCVRVPFQSGEQRRSAKNGANNGILPGNGIGNQVPSANVCRNNDGLCLAGCTPQNDNDCRCGTIRDRLRITEIDVDTAIDVGTSMNSISDFMGSDDIKTVILSPMSNGESRVAWTDTNKRIHVTPLDFYNRRKGPDLLTSGDIMRDMAAQPDGAAILTIRGQDMYLVRLLDNGQEQYATKLTGSDQADTVNDFHHGRLTWNGQKYGAYFGVHAGGHEGDKLKFVSANGQILDGGWSWGCSHSMDMRLPFVAGEFMPLCISDCYPEKGLVFNASTLVAQEEGNCGGTTYARLGGFVEFQNSMVAAYTSKTQRSSWDIAISKLSKSAEPLITPKKWLTETPIDETNVKIASYGNRYLLLSWSDTNSALYNFKFMDADGNQIGQVEQLDVRTGPYDDYKTFPNGDIGWAFSWGDQRKLKVMRLSYCE